MGLKIFDEIADFVDGVLCEGKIPHYKYTTFFLKNKELNKKLRKLFFDKTKLFCY